MVRRVPFSRQGHEVEGRVVAAQAETEAILARGSAVACTLVATGLRQRGQDLVSEPDRIGLGIVPDLDDRCCLDRPDRARTSAWPSPRGSIRPPGWTATIVGSDVVHRASCVRSPTASSLP